MEFAFLLSALRRYFWLVVLCAVIGSIPGLLTFFGDSTLYESRTVLQISPPAETGTVAVGGMGDGDRYIAGEISVMASLSDAVAEKLDGVSELQVQDWVSFEQQPLTNVVVVIAKAPTPKLAQKIASTYSETYFEVLAAQLAGALDPAIAAVDAELAGVEERLRNVDRQLTEALAAFTARGVAASAEQVAPSLASEREMLMTRFNELSSRASSLKTGMRVTSRVLREATLPTLPLRSSGPLLAIAGGVAGAFVGLVLALIAARLSHRVIEDEQVVEILGHPLVGSMPRRPEVTVDRAALLGDARPEAAQFLDSLGVRVEASGGGVTTTVLVTGVSARIGTTTVAASLARQVALAGAQVLLVDADRRHPELVELFGTGRAKKKGAIDTSLPNLRVCDLESMGQVVDTSRSPSTRRRDLSELISAVHAGIDVDLVVFDGGPLMDTASTVTLSRLCDVIVLTMPPRVTVRALETVSSELATHDHLLPIWVPTPNQKKRLRRRNKEETPASEVASRQAESKPSVTEVRNGVKKSPTAPVTSTGKSQAAGSRSRASR